MSDGSTQTFWGLFDKVNRVVVPMLQRDYAQGRAEEAEVRTLFLQSLKKALSGRAEKPLDLDFVYGSFTGANENEFSVLDGQQRLTTLFLLHWFLAAKGGRLDKFRERFVIGSREARFTYRTRPSTSEFFNELSCYETRMDGRALSEELRDCQWYFLSWENDPTVQAALIMLDAIAETFADSPADSYERLVDLSNPAITFQFLDLESFGLSDELYIKMNARGKPLTKFENFKAKLEEIIATFDGTWPDYRLEHKDEPVTGAEYFAHKIDTEWADLFWPYRNSASEDNTFDDELMNFMRLIIAYQCVLDEEDPSVKQSPDGDAIFGKGGVLVDLSLSAYQELGALNQRMTIRLIDAFDRLSKRHGEREQSSAYTIKDRYYDEESVFTEVVCDKTGYIEKLRFFAYLAYLGRDVTDDERDAWFRVVYNLTENTIFNNQKDFSSALRSLSELARDPRPVLAILTSGDKIPGFLSVQVLEERIKAHLIVRSSRWSNAVVAAENHPYFRGQIGVLLNFSNIRHYFKEHGDCNWTASEDDAYFARFTQYAEGLGAVFREIGTGSENLDYLWERAVLSKGNYLTRKGHKDANLLSSRTKKENVERDHTWRLLLRMDGSKGEGASFVKEVLDDPLFSAVDVGASLLKICEASLDKGGLEDWRAALIPRPELFAYCKQGFVENWVHGFFLLSESQRNHYHSELFSRCLYVDLGINDEDHAPFKHSFYLDVRSTKDQPKAYFSNYSHADETCSLSVCHYSDIYEVEFARGGADDDSSSADGLSECLSARGFEATPDEARDSLGYRVFKVELRLEYEEVRSWLRNLFDDLRGLDQ